MTPANAAFHDHLHRLATNLDQRPGTAEEVAAAVVFLAGPEATPIHRVVLPVDGGYLAAR